MRVIGREEMGDTTLLVQGPLMEDTYKFYCRFYPEVPKVFSTWEGNEEQKGWRDRPFEIVKNDHLRMSQVFYVNEETIVVKNKIPQRFYTRQNFDLQLTSTLSGMRFVKTKYVVKLRGDEWYSNLSRVSELILMDDAKIYFTPIFFRKWDFLPFHVSDHLLAGGRQNIKTMFGECLKAIFEGRIPLYDMEQNELTVPIANISNAYVAESMLGRMYLETKRDSDKDYKTLFKENFGIIQLSDLVPYKLQANYFGKVWYSKFDDCNSILSMEEL